MKDFSQVYAIGDIHGCKNLLERIHKKIIKKSEKVKGNKLLIYLGDYVDRGSKVKYTIETIINFNPKNFKFVFLKGNHDQMLLDFVNGKSDSFEMWLYNGCATTLKSYCGNIISRELNKNSFREQLIREAFIKSLPYKHLRFFNKLKFSYSWKDYFFVHAGIDPDRPLNKQREVDMIWTRSAKFLTTHKSFERVVVHGHTPNSEIEERSNRINLDTGAVYPDMGKLTCMLINTQTQKREYFSAKE